MNLTRSMRAVAYATDRDMHEADRRAELQESKLAYVEKRVNELLEARTSGIPSDDDIAIAFERMATLPELMAIIKRRIYEGDEFLADYLAGSIRAALILDCRSIAATEANALFDESVSTARH